MSACIYPDGIISQIPIEQCTGYVLLTAAEYQKFAIIETLFSAPDALQLQNAFMAGISLPLIAYLTAWAYSQVINFIR